MVGGFLLLRSFNRCRQKGIAGNGRKGSGKLILAGVVGIGAASHTDDDIPKLYFIGQPAGGTDADDIIYTVKVEQLIRVDSDRRASHAAALDRKSAALIGSGIAQHPADSVVADRAGEKGFRDELCPQGVAGHEDGLGDFAGNSLVVGGGVNFLVSDMRDAPF